ncbi:uncharacterized protein LOC135122110 [Zophobas morio]|uniref:uncharacterized protein LOC135122110 n=1 Tax=Zophobas morio TaxID=2755281 RepID=UPI003082D7D4
MLHIFLGYIFTWVLYYTAGTSHKGHVFFAEYCGSFFALVYAILAVVNEEEVLVFPVVEEEWHFFLKSRHRQHLYKSTLYATCSVLAFFFLVYPYAEMKVSFLALLYQCLVVNFSLGYLLCVRQALFSHFMAQRIGISESLHYSSNDWTVSEAVTSKNHLTRFLAYLYIKDASYYGLDASFFHEINQSKIINFALTLCLDLIEELAFSLRDFRAGAHTHSGALPAYSPVLRVFNKKPKDCYSERIKLWAFCLFTSIKKGLQERIGLLLVNFGSWILHGTAPPQQQRPPTSQAPYPCPPNMAFPYETFHFRLKPPINAYNEHMLMKNQNAELERKKNNLYVPFDSVETPLLRMLLGELPEYKRASLFTNWQIITWSTQAVSSLIISALQNAPLQNMQPFTKDNESRAFTVLLSTTKEVEEFIFQHEHATGPNNTASALKSCLWLYLLLLVVTHVCCFCIGESSLWTPEWLLLFSCTICLALCVCFLRALMPACHVQGEKAVLRELKTAIYNLTIQYGPSVKFVQCGHVDMLKNFITFKE